MGVSAAAATADLVLVAAVPGVIAALPAGVG